MRDNPRWHGHVEHVLGSDNGGHGHSLGSRGLTFVLTASQLGRGRGEGRGGAVGAVD